MVPFLYLPLRRAAVRLFAAASVLAVLGGALKPAAAQAPRVVLSTRSTSGAGAAVDTGALAGGQRLTVTLTLIQAPPRAAALSQLLAAQTTVGSTAYHQWLTPAAFAESFGATSEQLSAVNAWAQAQGLAVDAVSASGQRVTVSGPAGAVEAAFAVSLHAFVAGTVRSYANVVEPSLPEDAAALITAVDGLDTRQTLASISVTSADPSQPAIDTFAGLAAVVDANRTTTLALTSSACMTTVSPVQVAEYAALFRQAAAQGMSVLSASACAGGAFPDAFVEVTSIALPGTQPVYVQAGLEARPTWQTASGVPEDGFRHTPDVSVSSLAAMAQTIASLAGSGRLGNLNPVLYALAPTPGLYTQPDGAPAGTWEQPTGLGLLDLQTLATVFPRGIGASSTSFSATNYSPIHGQGTSFTSSVTSNVGGTVPTGTVNFVTAAGVVLGTAPLVNGNASFSTSTLDGGNYTIGAVYSGDATYAPSSSPTGQLYVQPEPSALSIAVGGTPVIGSSYTVTVTDAAPSGIGNPTGPISVNISGTSSIFTATLAPSGTGKSSATVTIPATIAGTLTLSITCTTTPNYSCFNPYTTTVTIAKATPTLSISFQPNPPISGATIALNAAVTTAGTASAPTGSVTFYDNGTVLNASQLNNGATSTTGTVPTTSTHSITATYAGDASYNSVSTTANSTSSGTITTSTSLQASSKIVTAGQAITFTATIAPASTGPANPTGTVQFFDGSTLIGTANVNANVATFAISTLSATAGHSITATYAGDGYYGASTSAPVVLSSSNTGIVTTTTLQASANSVTPGQAITLTATVSSASAGSAAPSGSVSFYDGATLIGSATVSGGTASFATASLAGAASHSITAVYSGDGIYSTSTSQAVTIGKSASTITTSITLTPSATVVTAGQSITFTASVTPVTTASTAPTGNVSFYDGTLLLGTAALGSNKTATFTTSSFGPTASHSITAVYTGDTVYTGSTSAAVVVNTGTTTGNTPSTTALAVSQPSTVVGSSVTFTASVAPAAATGTVQFTSGSVLCTATLSAGVASCSLTTLPIGVTSVTAVYLGDGTYAGSVSAATKVTVTASTTAPNATLMLTVTPATALPSTAATANVTVTSPTGAILSGTISVTVNGVTSTSALSGTAASNAVSLAITVPVTPGVYTVTASCSGASLSCTPVTATLTSSTTASTKIATTTVLASVLSATAAGSYTLTASVTPASVGASALTGTVTFYDGTTLLGTALVSAGTTTAAASTATTTVTLSATATHSLTAVYSGDTLYAASTSAAIPPTGSTSTATIALNANVTSTLAGGTVTLTATVSGLTAAGLVPTGVVSFYTAGATPRLLGTATLGTVGTGLASATFTTTAIPAGTQMVYAVYAGDTNFATVTSSSINIGVSAFSLSFIPATLTLRAGQTATATVIVNLTSGFAGSVFLGCTPPPNTLITCSISPAALTGASSATLTVNTTAMHQSSETVQHAGMQAFGWASLAALFLLQYPRRRRRLPVLLAALLALALSANLGCSDNTFNDSGLNGGTPLGTAVLTITSAASDGTNVVRHTDTFQVTVQ